MAWDPEDSFIEEEDLKQPGGQSGSMFEDLKKPGQKRVIPRRSDLDEDDIT